MGSFKAWAIKWKRPILTIKNLLVILIPGLIVAFGKYDADFTIEWARNLHDLIKNGLNSFWGFVGIVATPAALGSLVDVGLVFAEESQVNVQAMLKMYQRLVEHLNAIVAEKAKSFEQYRWKHGADIFKEITRPNERIKIILDNLCAFLKGSLEKKVKIVLFEIKDGVVDSVYEYVPADANPTIDQSQYKSIFASHVAKKGNKIFIEDIASEGRKSPKKRMYVPSSDADCGSIIGYPLKIHGNTTKYVLTVKTDDTTISEEFDKAYSCLISYFIQRIKLEACLHEIKVLTKEGGNG